MAESKGVDRERLDNEGRLCRSEMRSSDDETGWADVHRVMSFGGRPIMRTLTLFPPTRCLGPSAIVTTGWTREPWNWISRAAGARALRSGVALRSEAHAWCLCGEKRPDLLYCIRPGNNRRQ